METELDLYWNIHCELSDSLFLGHGFPDPENFFSLQ